MTHRNLTVRRPATALLPDEDPGGALLTTRLLHFSPCKEAVGAECVYRFDPVNLADPSAAGRGPGAAGAPVLAKRLVVGLVTVTGVPLKIVNLARVDHDTLALINDNDFGTTDGADAFDAQGRPGRQGHRDAPGVPPAAPVCSRVRFGCGHLSSEGSNESRPLGSSLGSPDGQSEGSSLGSPDGRLLGSSVGRLKEGRDEPEALGPLVVGFSPGEPSPPDAIRTTTATATAAATTTSTAYSGPLRRRGGSGGGCGVQPTAVGGSWSPKPPPEGGPNPPYGGGS